MDASLLGVIFVPDSTGNACELAIASSQKTYGFIRESTYYVPATGDVYLQPYGGVPASAWRECNLTDKCDAYLTRDHLLCPAKGHSERPEPHTGRA